jgi:putative transcriptional regulator
MAQDLHVATGTLLASAPDLLDPNFMHTVSVICEHTARGAYGMVLNKRSSITIDRLLPEHPILGRMPFPVAWGGPVENDTLQIVHRFPERIPGSYELALGLQLGGELDCVAELLQSDPSPEVQSGVRFVLGCAGWGPRQLDRELAGGSWVPLPLKTRLVFGMDRGRSEDQDETWQAALRSLGREGRDLASLPPDIGWN